MPLIPFKVQWEGEEELYIAEPEAEVGGVELAALVIHHPKRERGEGREKEDKREGRARKRGTAREREGFRLSGEGN